MSLPKVLIFGQPFNNSQGGGITLSSLFKGWEKDKIAVMSTGHMMYNVSTDICSNYYQLGKDEFRWRFPFNLLQRRFTSGQKTFENESEIPVTPDKTKLRFKLVNQIFYPTLEWLGIYHSISSIKLSGQLKAWLAEYNPDILYLQVSTRDSVLFALDLIDYLKISSVIHVMDDWPSTISTKGPLKNFWSSKIDNEFKKLLNKIDNFLSISDAMTSEYLKRYGKDFKAFHNPIDLERYVRTEKTEVIEGNDFKVLYIGRIGTANKESIRSFAEAVSHMAFMNRTIQFYIYTPDYDTREARAISKLSNIKLSPPVNHENIPALLQGHDLLLLPLDFSENGLKYAKYSMPTKASEYMISGTPIIVFAPKETMISKFCSDNKCGYCVSEQREESIAKAIIMLANNKDLRKELSNNAVMLAKDLFNAEVVTRKFQKLMIETARKKVVG